MVAWPWHAELLLSGCIVQELMQQVQFELVVLLNHHRIASKRVGLPHMRDFMRRSLLSAGCSGPKPLSLQPSTLNPALPKKIKHKQGRKFCSSMGSSGGIESLLRNRSAWWC